MHVVVDGILTHYEIVGKDNKKKLLILHGWQRSLIEWLPTAKVLSEKYQVILLDLPGFGNTARPESTYTIYDYATFVEHFLDKLGMSQVALMGHSFGGRIGIILGAKTKRLQQLTLVDAAAIEKKSNSIQLKITIHKLIALPFKALFPQWLEKMRKRLGSDDYQAAGAMRDIFIQVVNEDLTPLLKKITIPTLVIWGEKDSVRPIAEGVWIKTVIPHSHLRVVWGAGHSPYLEKPREFLEILQENI